MNIKPRALIVDTDLADICGAVNALSGTFEIYLAKSSHLIKNDIHQYKIHLVLLKVKIESLQESLELIRLIRSDCQIDDVPILISLSDFNKFGILECINAGAQDYIVGSTDIDLFVRKAYNLIYFYLHVKNRTFAISQSKHILFNKTNLFLNFKNEVERIIENDQDCNIKTIAKQLSTSLATLERVVKRATGMTPKKYIMKHKLERVNILISSKRYNLKEVAFMAGFSSPSHFSRTYKQYFGLSPIRSVDSFS